MLDFQVLGPLRVLDDDRTIELGGARQRAVLAILFLHRGETVSVDRIADLLWGERPPATAVKTVQVYVSHLRRALVDEVLVARGADTRSRSTPSKSMPVASSGWSTKVAPRCPRTLPSVPPSSSAPAWRSGGVRRLPTSPTRGSSRMLSRGSRSSGWKRSSYDRGRSSPRSSRGAGAGARRLVREHPTRERLRAQHMLALYRSGRQADALDSFRDARRALIDELGLEPGRELRDLEQAILAQDPSLDPPRAQVRGSRPVRRRGVALIAAGAVLAAAVVGVTVAVSRSSDDIAVLPDSVAVIDPESDLVVADVQVGVRPETVVADDGSIWVANVADGTVMQIDMDKRRVVATIAPDEVDVNALAVGDGSAWIADARRGAAVRVDADLGSVADSVPLPTPDGTGIAFGTRRAAIVSDGSLWVTSSPLAEVLRVDTATKRVTGRIDVGNEPSGLAAADGAIWVADSMDNNVHRIVPTAAGAVTDTIPLGNGPGPIAAGEGAIWVANMRDGTVSRIDPTTRSAEAEIEVGRQPTGIAVGADAVWVANSLSGTVSRIDPETNSVTKTIAVGGAPHSVAVAGGRVWVSIQEAAPPPAPAGGPSAVRLLVERDPVINDPFRLEHTELQHATCGRLLTYESSGAAGELVPELAAAPPAVSDDGRTYTFVIRDGYRFSPPSGEPVTAAAFERAIERGVDTDLVNDIRGVAAYRAGRARTIAGVSARGNELTIRLKRPWPRLAPSLATLYFCAAPPDTPDRPRGLERVATAGPYYVAEAAPGRRLVLRRNPGYPGPRPRAPRRSTSRSGSCPPARSPTSKPGARTTSSACRAANRLGWPRVTGLAVPPRRQAASGTSPAHGQARRATRSTRAGRCSRGPTCGGR